MNTQYFINYLIYDNKNNFILNTTWLALLPIDIINMIYKINIDWSINILNKHMRPFFKMILKNKIEFISKMINFAGFKCDLGFGMYNYSIFYKNRVMQKKEVLRVLNLCKCCDRHQINRPNKLKKWIELDINNNQENHICECNCRHLARYICRACE